MQPLHHPTQRIAVVRVMNIQIAKYFTVMIVALLGQGVQYTQTVDVLPPHIVQVSDTSTMVEIITYSMQVPWSVVQEYVHNSLNIDIN